MTLYHEHCVLYTATTDKYSHVDEQTCHRSLFIYFYFYLFIDDMILKTGRIGN